MGRYVKGRGKLKSREWKGFEGPAHMVHFLSRTRDDDPMWQHVAVRTAKDFLDERRVPRYKIRRNDLRKIRDHHPHVLGTEMMHEWRRARDGRHKGAGLGEAIASVFSEGAHLLGVDALASWVGLGPKQNPMSTKEEEVAAALQQSYKAMEDRRGSVGSLTRRPEYDTDRIAVWEEQNGHLLVTVHGTTLNWSDLKDDAGILAGQQARSSELATLLEDLDNHGETYDLAGHSLATQFIQNVVRDGGARNADDMYLFNPASSPFQSVEYLKENANDDRYTYFINQGDLVSSGLYQQMNQDTMDNRVHMGPYRYDPLQSHYMAQWVSEEEQEQEKAKDEVKDSRKTGWTVNLNK